MSIINPARSALLDYPKAFIGVHVSRLRGARTTKDAGASAIELAIITAILVLLAGVVLAVVSAVVTARSGEITTNNGGITGG